MTSLRVIFDPRWVNAGFRPPDKAHLERHLERDTKNCQYCDFVTCKEVALARHLIDHLQNQSSFISNNNNNH